MPQHQTKFAVCLSHAQVLANGIAGLATAATAFAAVERTLLWQRRYETVSLSVSGVCLCSQYVQQCPHHTLLRNFCYLNIHCARRGGQVLRCHPMVCADGLMMLSFGVARNRGSPLLGLRTGVSFQRGCSGGVCAHLRPAR